MDMTEIIYRVDGGELCTQIGRVPRIGETPIIENGLTGTAQRYRVTAVSPILGSSTGHTSIAGHLVDGRPLAVREERVYVDLVPIAVTPTTQHVAQTLTTA